MTYSESDINDDCRTNQAITIVSLCIVCIANKAYQPRKQERLRVPETYQGQSRQYR